VLYVVGAVLVVVVVAGLVALGLRARSSRRRQLASSLATPAGWRALVRQGGGPRTERSAGERRHASREACASDPSNAGAPTRTLSDAELEAQRWDRA